MRTLLLCVLAFAVCATEQQIRRRVNDALTIMQRIEPPGAQATLDRAVQALVQNGALDSEARRAELTAQFKQIIEERGKPTGEVEWVSVRELGRDTFVMYAVLSFRRGAVFARLVGYRAADNDAVISSLALGGDPHPIFPPELLVRVDR